MHLLKIIAFRWRHIPCYKLKGLSDYYFEEAYMKRYTILIFIMGLFLITGCEPTPENTEIVVSDAITSNGDLSEPEVVPNATVYKIEKKEKKSLVKYLMGKKLKDMKVRFYVRTLGEGDVAWTALGDGPVQTDENGRAALTGLRQWLPGEILAAAPLDLQLRADVIFNDGQTVSDDLGLMRVMSSVSSSPGTQANPSVLCTDHDNTLHSTGGQNTLADWISFINWAKEDWPLVDQYVVPAIQELRTAGTDVVIVSGLPTEIRALCRKQVNSHFEDGAQRSILFIIKGDLSFEHGFEFKACALNIVKKLYGEDKVLAMVGDTVREDGYGAYANRLLYIPFNVYYGLQISLLDTEGYGFIDPAGIAWDWSEVMAKIAAGETVTNYFLRNENGFLNIAHRGGRALMPENTLEAYRNALSVGAESLEGDLHATSDGVVVVSHDKTVDRCTDGTGKIKDMTFAQLRQLDAGYRFTTDNGATYPYRGKGLTIPTFEEVLNDAAINKAPMVVEIKQEDPSIIKEVLDIIEAYNMQDRLVIGSFDKSSLDDIRAEAELRGMHIITSLAEDEVLTFFLTPLPVMLASGYTAPGKVLQVPTEYTLSGLTVTVINNSFMNKARYLGLKVQVWTINDADEMRSLIDDYKVDGIMSDNPILLESVINE